MRKQIQLENVEKGKKNGKVENNGEMDKQGGEEIFQNEIKMRENRKKMKKGKWNKKKSKNEKEIQ